MGKAHRKTVNCAIYKQIAELCISEHDRQRATYALRGAEAIVDTVSWVKERIASLRSMFLKPGFKH
ncbi:MAG: hypothetical protein ACRET7_01765 [Burkholderiales bacterium]